jgi:hypothetical protein
MYTGIHRRKGLPHTVHTKNTMYACPASLLLLPVRQGQDQSMGCGSPSILLPADDCGIPWSVSVDVAAQRVRTFAQGCGCTRVDRVGVWCTYGNHTCAQVCGCSWAQDRMRVQMKEVYECICKESTHAIARAHKCG